MNTFPAICVDNFYDDPDKVREFALSLNYSNLTGYYPGKRTGLLHEVNPNYFDIFCKKLFSLLFDFECQSVNWEVSTCFQLIPQQHQQENSPKNSGWIHTDAGFSVFSGVIYLTPDINPNCGTSLYNLINEDTVDEHQTSKLEYYLHGIDNDYDDKILKHNSSFQKTVTFDNLYNRMVAFDNSCWHAQTSMYSEVPRLTQVFFVYELESSSKPPIHRMREHIL